MSLAEQPADSHPRGGAPGPAPLVDVANENANKDAVVAELAVLRSRLRGEDPAEALACSDSARALLGGSSTLDRLSSDFDLSSFERSVLLLAAGQELVAAVGAEILAATGSPALTFGAAISLLPGAHWSALTPNAPLRAWDLVTLDDPRTPAHSPLSVDERVLHHLVGAGDLDARLTHLVRWAPPPVHLPGAFLQAANDIALSWVRGAVLLHGEQPENCRAVAAAAAQRTGMMLREVAAADLPAEPRDLAAVLRLLGRETKLEACAWLVDLDGLTPDGAARVLRAAHESASRDGVGHLVLLHRGPTDRLGVAAAGIPVVEVPRLDLAGRAELLSHALHQAGAPDDDVAIVTGVFDLSVGQAADVAQDVAAGASLWHASRRRSQVEPGGVARRIVPRAGWDQLVLPAGQISQLQALVSAVRHRSRVLDAWGFAERSARGLGTTSLFAGASGTGKTLAAEVIAHDLDLDLLHVDLSQVMSKYIGETEKNLGAVFDAAEQGSAVLLFDEADILFGRRSEVKDSHDRYANLEIGYLLQRMEQFRGLAILTTNARGALDPAFLRRLHAVVVFPYPDVAARARLWKTAFPAATPIGNLDLDVLARFDVPGGTIAAAALTAAYLAASQNSPVTTAHVREALGWELAKSGRTVAGR